MKIDFAQVSERLNQAIPGTSVIKTIRAYSSGVSQIINTVRRLFSNVVTQYNGIVQGHIVDNVFIDCTPLGMEGGILSAIAITKDEIEMNVRRLEGLVDSGDEEVPIAGTNTNPIDMLPTDSITPINIKGYADGICVDKDNNIWINSQFVTNALLNGCLATYTSWGSGSAFSAFRFFPLDCVKSYRITYDGSSKLDLMIKWITESIAIGFPASFTMSSAGPLGDHLYIIDKTRNAVMRIGYIRWTLSSYVQQPTLRQASFTLADSSSVQGWTRADSHSVLVGTLNSMVRRDHSATSAAAVTQHYFCLSLADGAIQVNPGITSVSSRVTIADIAQTLYGSPNNFAAITDAFDTIVVTSE